MTHQRPVRVLTSDLALAEQLCARLGDTLGRTVTVLNAANETATSDVVVTTTSACSPDECAGLAQSGVYVVVLAALPSNFQEQNYRSAGAAGYLPMTLDIGPLADTVLSLA